MEVIFEYAVVILLAAAVYAVNSKTGMTVKLAKKTSRIVYNMILIIFIILPFVLWEIFDVENNWVQHVLYGLSIGALTLTGNYEKNRMR